MIDQNTQKPKVAILLAAYNGEKYIKKQIESIFNQKDVHLDIFISLDRSTDRSIEIINELCTSNQHIHFLPYGERFGNAGRNFYRLIRDTDIGSFEYIAFSDQDDYWHQDKLIHAIKTIKEKNIECYSSDVIAYWPSEEKRQIIKKSQPQKEYDYIFEAAGPGCTYLFSRNFLENFKNFLLLNWEDSQEINLHDWYIYAYARSRGIKWHIDNIPKIDYIQHGGNLVGVNKGLTAYKNRIQLICKEIWIGQVIRIYNLTKNQPILPIEKLESKKSSAFLYLSINSFKFRRKYSDSLFFKFIFFVLFLKNSFK